MPEQKTYFGKDDPPDDSVPAAVPRAVLGVLVALFIVLPLAALGLLVGLSNRAANRGERQTPAAEARSVVEPESVREAPAVP